MGAAAVKGKAEAWRERIANQQASGLSLGAWCRQNNQPEHAFYWWRSRLGGVYPGTYRKLPDEVKLLWYLDV